MPLLKKEYQFIVAVILFISSTALDWINGPLKLIIKSPYQFIQPDILSKYPFTAVSILVKVLAVWLSILLILSLMKNKFLIKSIILLIIGTLAQLFSIQQFATGLRVTSPEWTLAVAFSGLALLATVPLLFIIGLFQTIRTKPKTYSVTNKTFKKDSPTSAHKKSFEFGIDTE